MSIVEEEVVGMEEDNIEDTYLIFGVAEESYAVGIEFVTEVIGLQKILEVPDVPDYIRGVINLRGNVIPVMDMRQRFSLESIDYTDRTVIIVLDVNDIKTGLIVDGVKDVLEITEDNIDPPPQWSEGDKEHAVTGMGKKDDTISIMLDVEKIIFSKKKITAANFDVSET